jgi:hypothetical protein
MEKLLDALYDRLILRDAFGKVLPGLVWLSALVIAAWGFNVGQRIVMNVDWLRGLTLIGAGWVMGFAVQSVGKLLWPWRLETFPPGAFADEDDYSVKLVAFHKKASEHNEQQLERFITVKDATGNSYVAGLLASATLLADWITERLTGISTYPPALSLSSAIVPFAFSLLAIYGLRRQHLRSSGHQARHIKAVLGQPSDSVDAVRLME